MKHKFSGQICVFCNKAPSETADHALGRKFFLEERRGNLPQVPACRSCNNKKAELEYYLMTVLRLPEADSHRRNPPPAPTAKFLCRCE
jgi:hypothetical protein